MNIKYINKTKMLFVTTLLFISMFSFTNTSSTLLQQQVKATSSLEPDLPMTAEVCKHDTNPNDPSYKAPLSSIISDNILIKIIA